MKLGSIYLFPRDGVSIIETDTGPVSVTPWEFLVGWQGRRPPFGNNTVRLRSDLLGGKYDVAAWGNDEVKARWTDASGKRQNVTVEQRGKPFQYADAPTPPADAERQHVVSLNITFSEPREQQAAPSENKQGNVFDD